MKNAAFPAFFGVRKVCMADLELLHETASAVSENCRRQLEVLLTLTSWYLTKFNYLTDFYYIMNLRFMISIRRSPNEQAHSSH